jgi:hypothetical protein
MSSTPILRRILFYAFILAFLVLCPLAILYVLGYDIRPAGEARIVHGGDLYVASFPTGAGLWVDGRPYYSPTPTPVLNLAPGLHRLQIRMNGYRAWAGLVTIRAGQTTLVNDVLLIPERWPQEELDTTAFEQLLPFSSDPDLLLRKGPRVGDLFFFNMQQRKLLPLAEEGSAYAGAQVLAAVPLRGSSVLLLEVWLGSSRLRLLASIQSGGVDLQDISELTPEGVDRLQWAAGQQQELFYYQDEALSRIDVSAGAVEEGFLRQVRGFGVQGRTLYILNKEGDVLTWDQGLRKPTRLPGFEGIGDLFPDGGFVRLIPFKDGPILFSGREGRLVAGSPVRRLPIGEVRGFRVEADPMRLLLWKAGRLGTLKLSAAGQTGQEGSAPPRLQWIPVRAAGLEQAFFVLAGSHILYRNADRVFLLSSSSGDGQVYLVARVRSGTSVYYSEPEGKLYYLDASTGRPSELEIVHRSQLVDQLLLDLRKRF